MIVHDAATTFVTLIDTAVLWMQVLAFVLCVVAFCAGPLIAPALRRTRRAVRRPVPAPSRRLVPSWAHTEPYDYDPAA